MGVSLAMEVPPIAGWCLLGENPHLEMDDLGGTHISTVEKYGLVYPPVIRNDSRWKKSPRTLGWRLTMEVFPAAFSAVQFFTINEGFLSMPHLMS